MLKNAALKNTIPVHAFQSYNHHKVAFIYEEETGQRYYGMAECAVFSLGLGSFELSLMQEVIEIEIKMKIRIETINVEFIYYLESFCST